MATTNNYKVITSVIANGIRIGAPIITRSRDESPMKVIAALLSEHKAAGATCAFDTYDKGGKCPFNGTAKFANDIEFFIAVEVNDAPQDKLTGLAIGNTKGWMKIEPKAVVVADDLDDLIK